MICRISLIENLVCRIGFLTQEDILYDKLIVYETLIFVAKLRLPSNMSKQQKLAKVERALQSLHLERDLQFINLCSY
jgi:ABC-type multidrug transport system ATPase subunit